MKRRKFLIYFGLANLVNFFYALFKAVISQAQNQGESKFQTNGKANIKDSVVFYVAPKGNDSWSGMQITPNNTKTDGPFATLEQARNAIRQIKRQQDGSLKQSITVLVRGGTYFLTKPLVFTSEDSGTEDFPVTYKAYEDEKPIISGGRRIGNWKEQIVNGKQLWVAELSSVPKGEWYFRNLWVNDQRCYRSRYPKSGYLRVDGQSPGWNASNWRQPISAFKISKKDLKQWKSLVDAEAVVGTRWETQHLPIKNIDYERRLIVCSKSSHIRIDNQDPFYLENSLDFLDSPGEWYLERSTALLYYFPQPGENKNTVEFIAPVLSQLVELKGSRATANNEIVKYNFVEYINFQGLTFSHTNWELPSDASSYSLAAIQTLVHKLEGKHCSGIILGEGIRYCSWKNCEVSRVGSWGIDLGIGCQHNKISKCELFDLGAGGIRIGLAQLKYEFKDDRVINDNEITDCHIHQCGRIFHNAVGIWIGQSHKQLISRNHIHNLFYSGISVGWWGYNGKITNPVIKKRNHIVEFNYIHNIGNQSNGELSLLDDLGSVYTIGEQAGTKIIGNVIHDIEAFRNRGWGIYLDEGSSKILVEKNLVFRTKSGGFHLHYGKENIVRNNIFAFGKIAQIRRTRSQDHLSLTFEQNIVYWNEGKLFDGKLDNLDFVFNRNLYWQIGRREILFSNLSWQEWRSKGMDQNSIISDPLFIDSKRGIFLLRPNSPAFQLGFQSLSNLNVDRYE